MAKVELTTRRRNFIVAVMLISAFVAILNQTLLNTALPSIMRELNINESTSQWLVTGFMLVNGVMIPLTAYLMDRIKTRPLYLAAMGTFLLGSIVAALAPNFGVLMLARVIQAMGTGVLMPLMQFTLFTLFSKEHRGFAMGLAGLVIQFAPAIVGVTSSLNPAWQSLTHRRDAQGRQGDLEVQLLPQDHPTFG
nr:MFS transporter [Staphylococcus aureus]